MFTTLLKLTAVFVFCAAFVIAMLTRRPTLLGKAIQTGAGFLVMLAVTLFLLDWIDQLNTSVRNWVALLAIGMAAELGEKLNELVKAVTLLERRNKEVGL